MRALITRPLEDAKPLANDLKRRGYEPVLAPLISIVPLQVTIPDLSGVQALLFTSANGVRIFAQLSRQRNIQLLTVGDASADMARALGFTQVASASGDVGALAELACRLLDPKGGRLYHLAGQPHTGDLVADLTAHGFKIDILELYRTQAALSLPEDVIASFRQGELKLVLFYSQRTAETFTRLVVSSALTRHMAGVTALCLSQAVAEAADLPFAAKKIAASPDQESLLALLAPLSTHASAKQPASRRRSGAITSGFVGGFAGGAIGATLIAAAIVASAPFWREQWLLAPMSDPALTARLERLEQDSIALQQSLEREAANSREALAKGNRPALAPDMPIEWQQRLSKLEQAAHSAAAHSALDDGTLASIAARIDRAAMGLAQMEERVSRLEQGVKNGGGRMAQAAALAVTAAQLADVTRSNRPFASRLASLRGLAGNDADFLALLEPLTGAAHRGVAQTAEIVLAFHDAARKAKAADLAEGSQGWQAEIQRFLGALVTIRRTKPQEGAQTIDRLLLEAESRLKEGDLAAALEILEALPQQASLAIDPWRQQARQRVELDRAVQAIAERALSALAQNGT